MPIVIIDTIEGLTEEKKEKVIKGITRTFEGIGIEARYVTVIIHDIPKSNVGLGGEQASKLPL